MKVLVTGFDPFGGETVNPAYEAVKKMPDEILGAQIVKIEVPTVFSRSGEVLEEAIKTHQPDAVLCVGQAGGRSCLTVERVAINLAEARIPDNDGKSPMDEKIREDGDIAYFTTLPAKAMIQRVKQEKIPCQMSYTAGTYVCNCLMYHALYLAAEKYPHIRAGFIHVPFACEQVVEKPNGTPSMSIEDMARGLVAAVEAIVSCKEDAKERMGTTH